MQKIDSMSQFNNIAPTRRDCSECLSLVLRLETALLKIESLFNEIDRARGPKSACVCRKLDSAILMVKAAKDRS